MSGDQIRKINLLTSEKSAETQQEITKNLQQPSVLINVNGRKIKSNLNPNALEFLPTTLKNSLQLKINEDTKITYTLEEAVKKCLDNQNNTEVKNESIFDFCENEIKKIIISDSDLKKSRDQENATKIACESIPKEINEHKENNAIYSELKPKSKIHENVNVIKNLMDSKEGFGEIKNNVNIQSSEVLTLFDSSPKLLQNISESEIPDKAETEPISTKESDKLSTTTNTCSNSNANKNNTNEKITRNQKDPNSKIGIKSTIYKTNQDKSKLKDLNAKIQIKSKEVPLNTGTVGKTYLSTKPKVEVSDLKKSSQISKTNRDPGVAKVFKSSGAKISNPFSVVTATKPVEKYPRKTIHQKDLNKDTNSTRSSSSTDKSCLSNRSSTQPNNLKSNKTPLSHSAKTKESLLKTPRATVSSKLQKNGNSKSKLNYS